MLYKDIYIDKPLDEIIPDWNYLDEKNIKKFFGFKDIGDNVCGIRTIERDDVVKPGQKSVPIALPAIRENYEIGPEGVVIVPRIPFSAHITRAGTPHRTQHVFGYWHINDKDEIIYTLPAIGEQPPQVIIIMGHPRNGETDRFAWYCDKCLTLLFMRESTDLATFWADELAAVRDYNADPANQICPTCGHKNPLGYSAMQPADRPEEREARLQW